jgi:hypothetical protein
MSAVLIYRDSEGRPVFSGLVDANETRVASTAKDQSKEITARALDCLGKWNADDPEAFEAEQYRYFRDMEDSGHTTSLLSGKS